MAGLQRSTKSFRRQGSSGVVWDDKLLPEQIDLLLRRDGGNGESGNPELRHCYSIGGTGMIVNNIDIEDGIAPCVYSRSYSTPVATKPSSPTKSLSASGKPPTNKFSFKLGNKKL